MSFIVFEGLDGAGKSTLIKALAAELESQSIGYKVTREPGGTPLGEELRQILLRKEGDVPCPRAELLLYQAIRSQHVESLIRPSLEQNNWVICDRYTASSVAFQSGGRGLKASDIHWLNSFATSELNPDLWVLLDLDPESSFKRIKKRESEGQDLDRFESEAVVFHKRVRESYLQISRADPEKWLVLDATKERQELQAELINYLKVKKWLN